MKRSSVRHARSADPSAPTRRSACVESPGRRGRVRCTGRTAPSDPCSTSADVSETTEFNTEHERLWGAPPQTPTGRLSTEFCRLCHGRFSTRRLRQAFGNLPEDSVGDCERTCRSHDQSTVRFCSDFQRLLGVPVHRDPTLSQFICKNCHAQFYKCHSVLQAFRQRVNLTPSSRDRNSSKCSLKEDLNRSSAITSDPTCLHSLVSWTHQHAEGCRSCPGLKEVLEGQYWGTVRAVWCCVDGHSYVMDTSVCQPRANAELDTSVPRSGDSEKGGDEHRNHTNHQPVPPPVSTTTADTKLQSSTHSYLDKWSLDGVQRDDRVPSPALAPAAVQPEDSELSDRNYSSEEEESEDRRKSGSSDDSADVYPEKRVAASKRGSKDVKALEPKERRKPGPKPGWKKKIKLEREELPTIYKCPHQGCTAVYRGPDGMKKHIKEHHEEVRERPCPHPGCNKVFMIDRYLQRHVKLIHTEVRNYICDQCGQTFKQRKHLSVHQMRHSGAKPLQCEVCGFQCRQRASLKYHMTKHKAEADLEFACTLCGRRFEKAHNLNVHMSMVHPILQGCAVSLPPEAESQNPGPVQGSAQPLP
ncbi:zinc finger protein 276 isoform X1 [Electrophorus electricus]|uniref:Zinc finger protein 276 n=1 Tax=Electrophorus electricus TaxID=8005 RepID=A0A4W4FAJ8_ELEEL|nr:zinc finger protein 276 isoform X1 [Electrophorus electricus]